MSKVYFEGHDHSGALCGGAFRETTPDQTGMFQVCPHCNQRISVESADDVVDFAMNEVSRAQSALERAEENLAIARERTSGYTLVGPGLNRWPVV